jgi:hypothetical protein
LGIKNLEKMWGVVVACFKELFLYLPDRTKGNGQDKEPIISK